MICARDIGRRVVVRHVIDVIPDGPRFTDITGELRAIDDTRIVVRRDDGETVTIAAKDAVATKVIPPRPVRFSEIAALERECADSWPACETEWLGGWLLRAGQGWTKRANTVLALGDPGMPLDDALEAARHWYAARGLPPAFGIPLPLSRRLDETLRGRGWWGEETKVYTAPLKAPETVTTDVSITTEPSPEWLALTLGSQIPEVAPRILGSGPDRAFAELWHADELVAAGRGAIAGDSAVLSNLTVAPDARRRGFGRRLIAALTGWAADSPASRMALQVVADNVPALRLYERLGYREHHSYRYLRPPE